MNYKFHPLADVLPPIEGPEFDSLVSDIAKNGLLNAITIHDDMILDGRNRERVCRAAGVEPVYAPFAGYGSGSEEGANSNPNGQPLARLPRGQL